MEKKRRESQYTADNLCDLTQVIKPSLVFFSNIKKTSFSILYFWKCMFTKFSRKLSRVRKLYGSCWNINLRREQVSNMSKCFMILILKAFFVLQFSSVPIWGRLGRLWELAQAAVVNREQKGPAFSLETKWRVSQKQGNCLNYTTYFSLPISPFWLKWFMILVSSYPTLPSGR